MLTIPHPGRPSLHPVQIVRVKLCACKLTEPMKAVTFDGGLTFEIVTADPIWRGAVLQKRDCEVVK